MRYLSKKKLLELLQSAPDDALIATRSRDCIRICDWVEAVGLKVKEEGGKQNSDELFVASVPHISKLYGGEHCNREQDKKVVLVLVDED